MARTLRIATLLALLVAACKTSDKPAAPVAQATGVPAKPVEATAPPAKSAAPAAKSAAPVPSPALPEAPVGSNTELETRGLAAMQRMADMFVADARDCDKLAGDLKLFIAENKALIDKLVELEDKQGDDERTTFSKRNAALQAEIGQKMQGALAGCASSPAVLAAMKGFPGE